MKNKSESIQTNKIIATFITKRFRKKDELKNKVRKLNKFGLKHIIKIYLTAIIMTLFYQ